jgi:hypothetical protein
MLEEIIAAKKVIVRFHGEQFSQDFIVPNEQKTAMREIIAAWEGYGGKA